MEWVETTGPTVEAALDAALDELGVDESEAEFEVLQEAKAGLFGRLGGNPARIRARVKPLSREKPGDRSRGRGGRPQRKNGGRSGSGGGSGGGRGSGSGGGRSRPQERTSAPTAAVGAAGPEADAGTRVEMVDGARAEAGATPGESGNRRRRRGRGRSGSGQMPQEESDVTTTEDVPIGEQADVADEFMRGLIAAFGVPAEVSVRIEEDVVLVDVQGEDLGLLVGTKGSTLRSIEDLVRTVVQRRTDGHGARIHVDIAGYQAKRRAALEKFAADLAQRVIEGGQELALEPMPAADRKVVHDTVAEIDGVVTISEGEDPRRRVVLRPA